MRKNKVFILLTFLLVLFNINIINAQVFRLDETDSERIEMNTTANPNMVNPTGGEKGKLTCTCVDGWFADCGCGNVYKLKYCDKNSCENYNPPYADLNWGWVGCALMILFCLVFLLLKYMTNKKR